MSATESFNHTSAFPPTYLVHGRWLTVRNGCLVDDGTSETIAGSDKSAAYLLEHGTLTKAERHWLEEWGDATFRSMADNGWHGRSAITAGYGLDKNCNERVKETA